MRSIHMYSQRIFLRSIRSTHDAAAPGRGGAPVAVPTLPFEPAALHGLRLGLHQEVARHQGPDGYFVIAQALARLHDFAVVDESNFSRVLGGRLADLLRRPLRHDELLDRVYFGVERDVERTCGWTERGSEG